MMLRSALSAAKPRTSARSLLISSSSTTSSPCNPALVTSNSISQSRRSIHAGLRSRQSLKPYKAALLQPPSRAFHATAYAMAEMRTESDAFGEIQVPTDRYWGAQTERSLENFRINQPQDRMPPPIIKAFGILKGAAAAANMQFGLGTRCYNTMWNGI